MQHVREFARLYRERGLAVCRLLPEKKRPAYPAWNRYSLEAGDFAEGDNIGIQPGRLSNDLVTVDLDSNEALRLADDFLPSTEMLEGRPGKPRSHRMFRLTDIPPDLASREGVVGGLGGPRNKPYIGPDGTRHIDLLGTGLQAAAPPSLWVSKDGTRQERRCWDAFGEPRVIEATELYACVGRLASACGCVRNEKTPRGRKGAGRRSREGEVPPFPISEVARQA